MQINQRSTIHQTLKQNRLINFIGSDTYIKSISNIPKNPEDSTPNCNEEKLLHALALSILQKKAANIEAQGLGCQVFSCLSLCTL